MSLREKSEVEVIPCARCRAESQTDVWGHKVCLQCFADWNADARFAPLAVESLEPVRLMSGDAVGVGPRLSHERRCHRYTQLTKQWISETQKQERAA